MKKKTRIISIMLIFSILMLNTSMFTFATTNKTMLNDKNSSIQKILNNYTGTRTIYLQEKVSTDVEILDKMGLLSDYEDIQVSNVEERAIENLKYIIDFGDISNTIEIMNCNENEFTVKITEGEKVNIYTEKMDGTIFIDGNKVEFSSEINEMKTDSNDMIMPLATETWFQERCPYGEASDYTYKQTALCYNKYEVKFNVALQKLTFSAFKSSLVKSVTSLLGITGAKKFVTEKVLPKLVSYNPDSKAVSYSIDVLTHKNYTSGFIGPIITRVWKYQYKYYATPNLKGSYFLDWEFKCQM